MGEKRTNALKETKSNEEQNADANPPIYKLFENLPLHGDTGSRHFIAQLKSLQNLCKLMKNPLFMHQKPLIPMETQGDTDTDTGRRCKQCG